MKKAARHDDESLAFDEVWCCFDIDKFRSLVPAAPDMARANEHAPCLLHPRSRSP